MGRYSVEIVHRIYNDYTGEYFDVCPDANSLELVELRRYTNEGRVSESFTIAPGAARLAAEAIVAVADRQSPPAGNGGAP